jgi:hypothetical protein
VLGAKISRNFAHRKWILCAAGGVAFFCLPGLVAEEAGCKDTISVKLGGVGETQSHFVDGMAKAREFIWRHWTEKRCGKLFVRSVSKEGVGSDSHDEIEVLGDGNPVYIA